MARTIIAQYLSSRLFRRDDRQLRFAELRKRDGDACRRCRRPMRFDLPRGHDQAPTIEPIGPGSKGGSGGLDNLCLCHTRCNRAMVDSTPEVEERLRLREAAAALAKSNKRARKAA